MNEEQAVAWMALAKYVLREADNALADYIDQLERKGASLHYGRRVREQIHEALILADKFEASR